MNSPCCKPPLEVWLGLSTPLWGPTVVTACRGPDSEDPKRPRPGNTKIRFLGGGMLLGELEGQHGGVTPHRNLLGEQVPAFH